MIERIRELELELAKLKKECENSKDWKPEIGDSYSYVGADGNTYYVECLDTADDRFRILNNNVYKSNTQAQKALEFQTEKAKLIKEIENSSDVIDWRDDKQSKYYLYYSYDSKKLNVETDFGGLYKMQGTTFTTNKEFLNNLIDNEPERVKKYLFGIE